MCGNLIGCLDGSAAAISNSIRNFKKNLEITPATPFKNRVKYVGFAV